MTKIRIVDVAAHAGISKSTVSQYLNGRFGHMSPQTKEKIRSAIATLNYVPNPIARSLKSDKTKTIGVIVRDITGFNTGRILRGIDDFCKKNEYNVLIYNTDFDEEIEKRSLQTLKQLCVDGIIITATGKNTELINTYHQSGFPIVQFQLEYQQSPTNIVLSDYYQAAQRATEYLIGLGHQRIAFMTQPLETELSRSQRYQGYLAALQAHNIAIDKSLLQYWDRDNGFHQSPIELINSECPPTALFTQHLAITTELLKLLNQAHISIPNTVSIIGFDEIPMVEMFKVPITVIKQDSYSIGRSSAEALLTMLSNKTNETKKVIVPCSLIERNSCRSIK